MEQSQQSAVPQVGPVVHQVKEHPRNFEQLIQFPRPRPWEIRKKDRDYKRGDGLRVVEWDPAAGDPASARGPGAETGRSALCRISWTSNEWPPAASAVGLPSDLILLGVELLELRDERPIDERIEDAYDSWAFLKSELDPGPPVPYTRAGLGLCDCDPVASGVLLADGRCASCGGHRVGVSP